MALVPEVRKDSPAFWVLPRTGPPKFHQTSSAPTRDLPPTTCFEACPPMINIPLLNLTCPHPWKTTVIGCWCLDIGKYLRPAVQKQLLKKFFLSAEDGVVRILLQLLGFVFPATMPLIHTR